MPTKIATSTMLSLKSNEETRTYQISTNHAIQADTVENTFTVHKGRRNNFIKCTRKNIIHWRNRWMKDNWEDIEHNKPPKSMGGSKELQII